MNCRSNKTCCSPKCYQRHWYNRPSFPFDRKCPVCGGSFTCKDRSDSNRKYCSQNCSRKASNKGIKKWMHLHPEKLKEYRTNQILKNPKYNALVRRAQRAKILEMLGGKCVVCGVDNPNWLHVDYIPTTRNEQFRHPRTLTFTRKNPHLFRILCANHHYELTLTGRIDGTEISQ